MAAKLKDIALRAGVSISTVNDVLSGRSANYATATVARIHAVAKTLNYKSNIAARGMREGKTYLIGVLFNGVNYLLVTEFIAGLQRVAVEHSYAPIFLAHDNLDMEKLNTQVLLDRRVDGLIVTPWVEKDGTFGEELYQQLRKQKIPMVEVFSRLIKGVPKVNFDNVAAARMAVRRLAAKGHQHIAHVTKTDYKLAQPDAKFRWNTADFSKGYETEMRACNLTPITILRSMEHDLLHPGSIYGQAFEMAPRVLEHPLHPTALICENHEEASGVIHYAWRHPELVPAGFEVTSMTYGYMESQNSPVTHYMQWSAQEAGAGAAQALIALLKKEPAGDVLVAPTWMPAAAGKNNSPQAV